MKYLPNNNSLIPVMEMHAMVDGLYKVLHYDCALQHWQYLPLERAFMDVMREEHRVIVHAEDKTFKEGMENAQYFTMSILVKIYPFLSNLKTEDHRIHVGEYCGLFGDQEAVNYLVKVGEAVSKEEEIWREGIYRISTVEPPEFG